MGTADPAVQVSAPSCASEWPVLGRAEGENAYGQPQQKKTGHPDVMKISPATIVGLTTHRLKIPNNQLPRAPST